MRIGFFQYDVISKNREANLAYIESTLKNQKFDLLVLPELFTSGYAFDSKEDLLPLLENLRDSQTVAWLTKIAKNSQGCITGTLPEINNGKIYNTAISVAPSGLIHLYRKIHLPDYEKRFFSSGNEIESFKFNEINIGLITCFDCWFSPLTSKLKLLEAQIICHSACFGGATTPQIIPIRALENQCFLISCNRTGTELFNGEPETYRGESQIVDPDGNVLYKAGNAEELVFVDINIDEVNQPQFGRYITKDFLLEHNKYQIELKK